MRFAEKIAIFFVRPIYRLFLERPLWWFLARVKAYFLAEVSVQLRDIQTRLQQDDDFRQNQRWDVLEERLNRSNAAQWYAIEQLLLALFRHPEETALSSEQPGTGFNPALLQRPEEPKSMHAAANIH